MFRVRVVSVVLFLSMVGVGFCGVEPSPFHRQLDALLDEVMRNLEKIADLEIRWPEETKRTLGEMTKRLSVFDVKTVEPKTDLGRQVKKSLEVLVLVSGSMLEEELPVPDSEVASRSVGLMDMISIYGFTPQPEPPGVDSLTDMKSIIDGMFDLAIPEVEVPK